MGIRRSYKDSWVVSRRHHAKAYQMTDATEISKSDFTLSAKVSRLTLDTRADFGQFKIRGHDRVRDRVRSLTLARLPIAAPVSGVRDRTDTDG